ncbi:TRAP transporter substrate-binding protein DctP [Pseudomonas sp. LRF_L74]|uniref:TRAP transporter substrate-binding protein DctP n=1 Tax=Pseudomonas sp. LRF_L74 TaxID=3369422 RepID=UPI003F5E61C3
MKTLLRLTCFCSLFSLPLLPAQAADYLMRVSHQLPNSHHVAKALETFADEVRHESKGKIDVQLFGGEQLFKATQNHMAVARGQVESALVMNMQWGGTIPEMQVFSVPYLITQRTQLEHFPDSPAAQLLERKLAAKGVTNIGWLLDASNMLFTSQNRPLQSPADFKGVKIRGLSKILDSGLIAMGAAPSTMPGSEVYQGLQTGVIDAAGSSVGAVYSRRYFEVQKYGFATSMLTVYDNLVVNPKWWNALPADMRQVVINAAKNAEHSLIPTSDEIDPAGIQRLRDAGMSIEIETPEQARALELATRPAVLGEFLKSSPDGQTLIDLISQQ